MKRAAIYSSTSRERGSPRPGAGASPAGAPQAPRTSVEATTCNYGLAPEVQHIADQHGLRIAATDETGEVRAIERKDHPFFVGTLYQPQLRSRPRAPHPVFTGFVEAAARGSVGSAAASNQRREHT